LHRQLNFEVEDGSRGKKKEIFADLGSNLTLNFGKLFVVMEEQQGGFLPEREVSISLATHHQHMKPGTMTLYQRWETPDCALLSPGRTTRVEPSENFTIRLPSAARKNLGKATFAAP
jgi:hypothetical protein